MIKVFGAALAAGIAGWMLHTAPCGGGGAAAPLSTVTNEIVPATGEAPVLHWIANEIAPHPTGRNLFAFEEKPKVVVVEAPKPVPIAIEQRVSVPIPTPTEPEFSYRCLGTFGPASQRFAVFAGADEIVNARIGDAIGRSAFVLREIGIEAVTIEQGTFSRRVEIGR